MAAQKIRIRLKAYDHEVIDSSARKIVETVTRTGARHRLDDFSRRTVDDLMVVGLEPDADLLCRHRLLLSFLVVGSRGGRSPSAAAEPRPAAADEAALLEDLGDSAGTDGPATLADGEAQSLFHGDRLDE